MNYLVFFGILPITLILTVVLGWRMLKHRRPSKSLLVTLSAALGAVFVAALSDVISSEMIDLISIIFYLVHGLSFLILIDGVVSDSYHLPSLIFVTISLSLPPLAVFLRILAWQSGPLWTALATTTNVVNEAGMIYLYGVRGGGGFLAMFRHERDRTSLSLLLAMGLISIAPASLLIYNIQIVLSVVPPGLIVWMADNSSLFVLLGLVWVAVTYILNVDYLFRIPYDTYLIVVFSTRSGLPLFSHHVQTKSQPQIDDSLIAGLFTALNGVFTEVSRQKSFLRRVVSDNVEFFAEWAENVATLVITQRITRILKRTTGNFTLDFEKTYQIPLAQDVAKTSLFSGATSLIKRHFPFLN